MTWQVIGESTAGTSHRTRNTPCQDAFRYTRIGRNHDWLVVAVADGAGSATHSKIGATLTCDQFIQECSSITPELTATREGMHTLFSTVRNAVILEAERLAVRPRDFACTALLACVGPITAVFAQLGDGAIVLGDGEQYRTAFWPEPAEYANATDFLTDEDFTDAIQITTTTEPITELALLTDGLQRLALDFTNRVPYSPFFRPLFRRLRLESEPELLLEPFRAFLDSEAVNAKTDDDKTLVLAVRQS